MKQYLESLSQCSLFAGIGRDELASMLGCLEARTVDVAKGDPVFLEGDRAGFVGFVAEGSVQIVRDDYCGNRSVLTYAEPGDLFAEAYACANLDTMPVSGYAMQDSRVILLSCKKMLTVCTNACRFHNQLVKNLLQVVAHKNLNLNQKIQYMSQKTTREKLLAYLLDQAKRSGSPEFTIPFDRQALADYLGVERSAMSAEIGKLRKAGILDCKGSRFHLQKLS